MANENRNLGQHPTMPRACLVVMACLASACAIAHTSLEQYLRESGAFDVARACPFLKEYPCTLRGLC
jgi:hypothetical protein